MSERAAPLGLAILGSTGSIGRQTLEVAEAHPDRLRIVTLAAATHGELLAEQARRHRPALVSCDLDAAAALLALPTLGIACETGVAGLLAAATHPEVDIVVVATAGHAAMEPTAAAIRAGKTIALANKETIVCAGALIMPLAREHGVEIRPVDSEHSAIQQGLAGSRRADIRRLILTASGGPFRTATAEELGRVTPAQALAHPTWNMGGKITIDSATMMNKGLEIIEAHWLFGVAYDDIDVVIHPESIVHSLVEFADASCIAQLSLPDMRLPIQYALFAPEHAPGPSKPLSLPDLGALHFFAPDSARFPALRLAKEAGGAGGLYPTVLSATDETAVEAFLDGRLSFLGICEVVEAVLDDFDGPGSMSWEGIAAADAWARRTAAALISDR